jgi:metallopeptidase MepB
MAKTPEAAMAFLGDLYARALRHIGRDTGELLKIKREELGSSDLAAQSKIQLYKWDVSYYTRLLQEQQYSVDHIKLSEYFPLQPTIAAMLRLFGDLFGFVFVEIKGDDRTKVSPTGDGKDLTWHEDVILYSVWDDEEEGNGFAGYLYLDLHPRPGKYNGAQCHPVQLGFSGPDGQRHYPSTALLANFSKTAFLKHNDMMMLFHELGHGIHDLSGRCQYSRFHGAETVSDFNEAPSQMLENWCWDREGLRQLSSHYETGQPLPDDMIDALVRSKHVQGSMALMQQLRVFLFDMAVHSTAPGENGEIHVERIWCDYVDIGGVKGPQDRYEFQVLSG